MPLSSEQQELLATLKARFEKNMSRHAAVKWEEVEAKLVRSGKKLEVVGEMERSGGEPDVVVLGGEVVFCDCAAESPSGRRSLCYDKAAWEKRKEHKPKSSVMEMAAEMGVELLSEAQYRELQELGKFDLKTSSWVKTPEEVRKLGGAVFCDRRYDTVFLYHNGADSYYATRGFRGLVRV